MAAIRPRWKKAKKPVRVRVDVTGHVAIRTRGRVDDVASLLKTIQSWAEKYEVTLQLVHPDAVYDQRHVASAVDHAVRSRAGDTASAKSLGAEILLYLSGQRQVKRALDVAGIEPGLESAVLVGLGERVGAAVWGFLDATGWSRDPAGIGVNEAALERLGVDHDGSDPSLAVLELVAMVDVRK